MVWPREVMRAEASEVTAQRARRRREEVMVAAGGDVKRPDREGGEAFEWICGRWIAAASRLRPLQLLRFQ